MSGDSIREVRSALRHEVAHDLASPVRGTAIVADLLTEALDLDTPDLTLLRELSAQLTTLVEETSSRLSAFATVLDD